MGPSNPIENVVIVVKENHSFDNYFGTFPGVNGASLPAAQDPLPEVTQDTIMWRGWSVPRAR